jgi:uncharacterized protein YjeT (DUF2065 family)
MCLSSRPVAPFALTNGEGWGYSSLTVGGAGLTEKGTGMDFFLCVLGMVMIIEGLPYFAFPVKMKVWITRVLEIPAASLRRFGFFLMLTGLGLVYLGRS